MASTAETVEGFLAAIADKPDEDAPRLVFSDWFEDYGDPQGASLLIK